MHRQWLACINGAQIFTYMTTHTGDIEIGISLVPEPFMGIVTGSAF
jgi:hypothetical protein